MCKAIVVNLYGGPGTGKSTMTADVFAKLKWQGFNAEMSLEYAKKKVWEETTTVLNDQVYVFGQQYHTQKVLDDKVQFIITDSPLLLSSIYNSKDGEVLDKLVLNKFREFDNINIFLRRVKPYNPKGRMQTEEEAKAIDVKVKALLTSLGEDYVEFDGAEEMVPAITKYIISEYVKRQVEEAV